MAPSPSLSAAVCRLRARYREMIRVELGADRLARARIDEDMREIAAALRPSD